MSEVLTKEEFAEYVSMKTRIGILMCLVAEEDEKRTKGNYTYPGSIDTTRIRQVLGMPQFVREEKEHNPAISAELIVSTTQALCPTPELDPAPEPEPVAIEGGAC